MPITVLLVMAITAGLIAFEFKCEYGNIETIYTCKVLAISGDGDDLTAVNCEGNDCTAIAKKFVVEGLTIGKDSKSLKSFPQNLKAHMADLKSIEIRDSELSSISVEDLKNFTKLVNLDLKGNQIQSLKHNLFAYTPNLTRVDFSENEISQVEFGIFRSLINLKEVRFENNDCINLNAGANFQFSLAYLELQLAVNCGFEELLNIEIIAKVYDMATNSSAFEGLSERITDHDNFIADVALRVGELENFKDTMTQSQKSVTMPNPSRRSRKLSRKSNVA